MTKLYPQVLVDASMILNRFISDIAHLKTSVITMTLMTLQLCDRFSEGKLPQDLINDPDFPRWEMFNFSYDDSDKAIIRKAGLTLATALYNEFLSLGLVHEGRIPYITNRIEDRSLIILDYMPH